MNGAQTVHAKVQTSAVRALWIGLLAAASWLLSTAPAQAAQSVDTRWALGYIGRSTNDAISDPKMEATLRALLPRRLSDSIRLSLWGPPDPVQGNGPALAFSACRPHDCGDRALLWLNTGDGTALGAAATCIQEKINGNWRWTVCSLTLGSKAFGATAIPAAAQEALMDWIKRQGVTIGQAVFVGADDISVSLDPGAFAYPAQSETTTPPSN